MRLNRDNEDAFLFLTSWEDTRLEKNDFERNRPILFVEFFVYLTCIWINWCAFARIYFFFLKTNSFVALLYLNHVRRKSSKIVDEGVKFDVGKGAFMLNDLFILFAGGFFAWFRSLGHYTVSTHLKN